MIAFGIIVGWVVMTIATFFGVSFYNWFVYKYVQQFSMNSNYKMFLEDYYSEDFGIDLLIAFFWPFVIPMYLVCFIVRLICYKIIGAKNA